MKTSTIKKLIIVFALGFSSGLPFALLGSTLQAWYSSEKASILVIGLLGLVNLPYTFRFFWGPLFDKFNLFGLGRRRGWLCAIQVSLMVGLFLLSFADPIIHPVLVGLFAFLLAILAASQDAVIDAHRAEYLIRSLHGLGASIASTAYRLAMLLSSSLALIIADKFGWRVTYQIIALFMLVGLSASVLSREPRGYPVTEGLTQAFMHAINELRQRDKIFYLLGFIFFYKFAEAFTSITSPIMQPFLLQTLDFSLSTIGYVSKGLGIIATVLGGLVAGVLLMRWDLYRALMVFGLVQAATNISYIVLAWVGHNVSLLALCVVTDNFANGLGSTALVALFMRIVDKRFTATQFSLFVAFSTIPRVICGPFGAMIEINFGWVTLFSLSFFIALMYIPFLIQIRGASSEDAIVATS
ncbi:MFS transporter [Legionella sp. W05-934-2]|jgi:PAT family beta-lactamase induction signal transducer AmpG|uniref:AmpG family muropeptide MFS transporter n=1 Tax=Legionella sp. W05-934-2 TaxID=1198649 RepID=UPI003462CC3D